MTFYRDPDRDPSDDLDEDFLEGYALVTEQRTVDLPAGEVELRFEGVAGGIIPQSAIVTGLPDGVLEKNRDAMLLSPSALLNAYLGRRVAIRRTSATGEVRTQDAIIRTDGSGGVVVQTAAGLEALFCTGLNETIVYPELPPGLSAKPTLSVRTRVAEPTRATVTLSYLATGFDWQANYVAEIADDGRTLDLFSWLTLASSDETSFPRATVQVVAGQPNRERADVPSPQGGRIALRCWPTGSTSDANGNPVPPPPPPPPAPMMAARYEAADAELIVVTATRKATQEELGDLKLYRVPTRVTVASNGQKQIAFLEKEKVPFRGVYVADIWPYRNEAAGSFAVELRLDNTRRGRLGEPLPAGQVVVFRKADGKRILVGEGATEDRAVGEKVDIEIASSPAVRYEMTSVGEGEDDGDKRRYRLRVTNALPRPVEVEIGFPADFLELAKDLKRRLPRRDGKILWETTIPANGARELGYSLRPRR